VLGRVGVLHGHDDTLGEEVLVDGDQILLGHQHLGFWTGRQTRHVKTLQCMYIRATRRFVILNFDELQAFTIICSIWLGTNS
jgi:hypothetical protein